MRSQGSFVLISPFTILTPGNVILAKNFLSDQPLSLTASATNISSTASGLLTAATIVTAFHMMNQLVLGIVAVCAL
jgi:hypothetical protein